MFFESLKNIPYILRYRQKKKRDGTSSSGTSTTTTSSDIPLIKLHSD